MVVNTLWTGFLSALAVLPLSTALPAAQKPIATTSNHNESNHTFYGNEGVLKYVTPFIGTADYTEPDNSAGMIPSATHQPAIWMGEHGQVVLVPGVGQVQPLFRNRGLQFQKENEKSTPYVYKVLLQTDQLLDHDYNATAEAAAYGEDAGGAGQVPDVVREGANGRTRRSVSTETDKHNGTVKGSLTAESHAGFLRFNFQQQRSVQPWIAIEASRVNWTGSVNVNRARQEVYGYNTERDDYMLGPDKAAGFKAYFVSRFSKPFTSFGVTDHGQLIEGQATRTGNYTGAYVRFANDTSRVEVRTGVSYVSYDQARRNLELQLPETKTFEDTVESVKAAWLEKLGRVILEGVNATDTLHDPQTIFYTAMYHALQYPSDFSEPTSDDPHAPRVFYSGYTDSVHKANDSYYQSWSIWDTFRAEHSFLTLLAPERVNSMMRSLLQIYDWTGRTPIWANLVETNIMIATNADVILANALQRGFRSFDVRKAWEAVYKDAYIPPINDTTTLYFDREPNTSYEARAGLTSYLKRGWVSNDGWSEAGSRTLDYSLDDYACAVVGKHAGAPDDIVQDLHNRTKNYAKIWNNETRFMQSRNANGTFASETWGWTEGDHWAYTFDVMHDVEGLATLFGGAEKMKEKLDQHFSKNHNLHSNEPSHHIPYLYSMIGYPAQAAEEIRAIAWAEYNNTDQGMSGNEDLGQMSSWYIFSAMGFYPVNPASDEYVVGTPFF
ncbi:hypothetical protein KEM56_007402 [Ascosphaera pollenicola]|nr:hypothetical protein KEM56_007402 [Ascosphaera pollenicola]